MWSFIFTADNAERANLYVEKLESYHGSSVIFRIVESNASFRIEGKAKVAIMSDTEATMLYSFCEGVKSML